MLPIAVIGAGPKAAALAAKSRALRDHGYTVPEIIIIEQHEIGANWTGEYGFTTGTQRLGTPPEKDIGFPYSPDSEDPNVTRSIFRDYSWSSYQIFQRKYYAEWIDRGRPHPTHAEWARYIAWVIRRSGATLLSGCPTRVGVKENAWAISLNTGETVTAQGLMITGPGRAKQLGIELPNDEFILNGDDFWKNLDKARRLHNEGFDSLPVVVIGGGETSASIVGYLVDHIPVNIPILVLTRSGAIFTRGEGYYENRMFTEIETWKALPRQVRQDVIRRGDRGVFSVEVAKKIAHAHNVDHRFMEVHNVEKLDALHFRINNQLDCQMVVLALGFDPVWFIELLDSETAGALPNDLEASIAHDLSVS